jgi:predicted ATP-grasp superfamily ATP-dependent carboligase
MESSGQKIFLLMPGCPKWSDKARLIKHYFQRMHNVAITIVDEPPTSEGIVIALEKDNLARIATQVGSDGSGLQALVLNDPNLYFEMDDKAECSWRQLTSEGLNFNEIPTMNMKTACEGDAMKFIKECASVEHIMLKPADEAASVGQAVIPTQDVSKIMSYLGESYVAQPFFSEHKILTIDFLAIGGEVKGYHCFYVDGPIENNHWKTGLYQQVLCNATPEIKKEFDLIRELTKQLCKKHGMNGIFEIEFLYAHGETYFLELNLLPGLYGIDQQGLMPLMEKILVPYLQHFQIHIQPSLDFEYALEGQFYPPSKTSHEYYLDVYGPIIDSASPRDASLKCLPSSDGRQQVHGFPQGVNAVAKVDGPPSTCSGDISGGEITRCSTPGLSAEDESVSTYPSEAAPSRPTFVAMENSDQNIFLLMPGCPKWSDKARLIQHYFQRMHNVGIIIVDEPPTSEGIVIALEKDNLARTATQVRSAGSGVQALVLSDPNLYFEMDDKAECAWRQLASEGVCFNEIPTVNMKTACEGDAMKFINDCASVEYLMLKPADEAASVGQAVVSTQDASKIISYLGKSYVAQPFFSEHKILTIDFLAIDGEVKGHHCFYVDGPIENDHWKTGLYQQVLCNATPEIKEEFEAIRELTKQLCKKHGMNGIFEIEFLYAHGKTYFLELNLLPGLYGIDQQGLMPLMEKILVPYLQHFHIGIQQRLDFEYAPQGQFYPPSKTSHDYYLNVFGPNTEFVTPRKAPAKLSASCDARQQLNGSQVVNAVAKVTGPPSTCSDDISGDNSELTRLSTPGSSEEDESVSTCPSEEGSDEDAQ